MNHKNSLIPPWKEPAEWREFHHTLSHTISTRAVELNRARSMAFNIREQFLAASRIMERLCSQTCTHCPAVCCLSAKIWADFKDVLFWHFCGLAVPLWQTISHVDQICRYLGSRGCTLPRLSRPFVCTWYLCPTQVSRLQANTNDDDLESLRSTLRSIKHDRQMMENAFVEAVS